MRTPIHTQLQSGQPLWYVGRECRILWGVLVYDLSATIVPGLLFAVAAWHTPVGMSRSLFEVLGQAGLYLLLYALVFCVPNQIVGIAEDRLNKPTRPLPSGMLTVRGAWVRWGVAMFLFTLLGWWWQVLPWVVLWQVTSLIHNLGHGDRHYVTKNLAMCAGVIAQLAGVWSLVAPLTLTVWTWITVPALSMLMHVSVQDLRDTVGDHVVGRRTLPLVIGWKHSRYLLAVAFLALPVGSQLILFAPAGVTLSEWVCSGLLTGCCLVIAGRLYWYAAPEAQQCTYMLFTYWYCLLLASAIILL
ncbi:MAG: UbiA family prenyltransferase [Blastochloris sp.]|nr:UbiA family prenyltransferase [Blastochloris sp.]